MKQADIQLSIILKMNKLFLKEDVESEIYKFVENKLNINNVLCCHQLIKRFKPSNLSKATFSYIERNITMIVETESFLELDIVDVLEILCSSELLITSELEVYDAASKWLSYKIEERRRLAKDLLFTVRFPFLSNSALKYLLEKPSSFLEINECYSVLKKKLENKTTVFQNKSSIYFTSRYCNQRLFNILICGGYNFCFEKVFEKVDQISEISGNFRNTDYSLRCKTLASMKDKRKLSTAVCVKGEVYVFGGRDESNNLIKSVEKYSPSAKTWNKVADMYDDERTRFCACAFMNNIFVFGGRKENDFFVYVTDSCLKFDTKYNNWKEVSKINEERRVAACTVFEGRIVVTGGIDNNGQVLNTAESYDAVGDTWSPMPSMIRSRDQHSLVVVRNKLFVIGGDRRNGSCEVFESVCNKFVPLKSHISFGSNAALSIGSEIFIFHNRNLRSSSVVRYDVDKDEWSDKLCKATDKIIYFSCVKLPIY